ncbi:hypothetical protein [Streptococcus suis]|nr:hypothetical protein [Streptococcus suis]HEM5037486.1 hypothetical protein [Streptococcus suis]
MPIIGFTPNPNALILQLTETSVVAKRISLPRASPYFKILEESKPFDFGWEENILVICDPSNSNNEFELLFPSMLPHATKGKFFILFSIVRKQNDVLLAGSLTLNDYATAHKFLRIRRREKYLPIIWE